MPTIPTQWWYLLLSITLYERTYDVTCAAFPTDSFKKYAMGRSVDCSRQITSAENSVAISEHQNRDISRCSALVTTRVTLDDVNDTAALC